MTPMVNSDEDLLLSEGNHKISKLLIFIYINFTWVILQFYRFLWFVCEFLVFSEFRSSYKYKIYKVKDPLTGNFRKLLN